MCIIELTPKVVVQDVRSRNQAFNDLAKDACGLVYTIVIECQNMVREGHKVPERVQLHIASLARYASKSTPSFVLLTGWRHRNLGEIENFAQKKVDRSTFKKIIFHSKDLDEITRYRQLLQQSLDVFGASDLTFHDKL